MPRWPLDPAKVLGELGDVETAGASDGDVLTFDDGSWVPDPGGGGATELNELTDVTITTPETADRLRFDGSEWVNTRHVWMPLTTVVGGEPELVWEDNDSLIPTEVPT